MRTTLTWLAYWLACILAILSLSPLSALAVYVVLTACMLLWEEQKRDWPRIAVCFGDDIMRRRDRCLLILWGLQPQTEIGRSRYRYHVEASWDWRPVLYYQHVYDRSTLWTGREREIIAWSWWGLLTASTPNGRRFWHAR